jgi:malonate decarboxylase alpha subunit
VQIAETFKAGRVPTFVESLDAIGVGERAGLATAPVMIYGDDVSHVVTEEGIAYLYKATGETERRAALSAVAGVIPVGLRADPVITSGLRKRGLVAFPTDLGIPVGLATRTLLAARSVSDLVRWSGGLYHPRKRFRTWQ